MRLMGLPSVVRYPEATVSRDDEHLTIHFGGLEAALQILVPERRRTDAVNFNVHLFREHLDQERDDVAGVFVLRRRAHYLQHTPVVGKSRHSAFLALRRQALVGLSAYVSQENPLLCRTLYRFQVDLSG